MLIYFAKDLHLLGLIVVASLEKEMMNLNKIELTLIVASQLEIRFLGFLLGFCALVFWNVGSLDLILPHLRGSSLLAALIQWDEL